MEQPPPQHTGTLEVPPPPPPPQHPQHSGELVVMSPPLPPPQHSSALVDAPPPQQPDDVLAPPPPPPPPHQRLSGALVVVAPPLQPPPQHSGELVVVAPPLPPPPPPAPEDEASLKRKRTALTMEDKQEIVKLQRTNESWNQQAVADEFNRLHPGKNLKRNTVSDIMKHAARILEISPDIARAIKHRRDPVYSELEGSLILWSKQVKAAGGALTDALVLAQATKLRDDMVKELAARGNVREVEKYEKFKLSQGWLEKFKKRYAISMQYGEASQARANPLPVPTPPPPAALALPALPLPPLAAAVAGGREEGEGAARAGPALAAAPLGEPKQEGVDGTSAGPVLYSDEQLVQMAVANIEVLMLKREEKANEVRAAAAAAAAAKGAAGGAAEANGQELALALVAVDAAAPSSDGEGGALEQRHLRVKLADARKSAERLCTFLKENAYEFREEDVHNIQELLARLHKVTPASLQRQTTIESYFRSKGEGSGEPPPQDDIKEPPQDNHKEPPQNVSMEPAQDFSEDPLHGVFKEPPQGVSLEPPKDVPTEPPQDTSKEPSQDISMETPHDVSMEPPRESAGVSALS